MTDLGSHAIELLEDLVVIESVNPGLVPGAAGEMAIVWYLEARLAAAGFSTTMVPSNGAPDRPSLVAIGPGEPDWPTVVLNGHLDTVGVAGMPAPFVPDIDGDRMYGRGTADMKGGVAAAVVAAEHLVASGAPVRVILALVADEEDASTGSESVIAAIPELGVHLDACIIAEPTDLALSRSLRGFAVVRVQFEGRAAHSSQAEQGINALTHLAQFMYAVDRHADEVRSAGGDLMVTLASGGTSAFVIPDRAECCVELRTTPEQRAARAVDVVADLLDPEWNATSDLVAYREGWRLDEVGPATDLSRQLGAALGTGVSFDAPYWMEAPLWQQVCPTLICGPSGGGLHAVDEWVSLSQVRRFTDALVAVLSGWSLDAQ